MFFLLLPWLHRAKRALLSALVHGQEDFEAKNVFWRNERMNESSSKLQTNGEQTPTNARAGRGWRAKLFLPARARPAEQSWSE
jgi:hypothetical protein